eukprot:CAMPEP_0180408704 /NCGR_PEP_ID=MMETSP0989-20121125/42413_1 /TAXON_ID=697907 /ORGANISM="non described non described, Strain CCMP2293" /LENGTH=119 /DNA_ID=CAMNT_0022412649 /DNA_START=14 /DNA_END=373 /DNA_ORIENTATION=+
MRLAPPTELMREEPDDASPAHFHSTRNSSWQSPSPHGVVVIIERSDRMSGTSRGGSCGPVRTTTTDTNPKSRVEGDIAPAAPAKCVPHAGVRHERSTLEIGVPGDSRDTPSELRVKTHE